MGQVGAEIHVEISHALAANIASWQRIFASRSNEVDAHGLLRNAAADLWHTLDVVAPANSAARAISQQVVVDALHDMAVIGGVDDADAQAIFAKAKDEPKPKANGAHGKEKIPVIFDPIYYIFPDPAMILARHWLYGNHYIRGAVGMTVGAPGRLKSSTAMLETVSMAVGRDLLTGKDLEAGPLRAAYINGEENQEELDRRVAAICQRYGIGQVDCGDRLWILSTRDKPIRLAVQGPRGNAAIVPDVLKAFIEWCERWALDVLTFDPLISFHAVSENDNPAMDMVCKEAFGAIAGKTRSVELVHHPRKLPAGEINTTVDDARGASSALGAVRTSRTLNFMTTIEAAQLGISEDERRRYVRIESGKSNPGPIGKAHWLRIAVVTLPNTDDVAVAETWIPKSPFEGVSVNDMKVVQKVVQGGAYRADSQSPEWLGWWMAENLSHLNITTRHSDNPKNKAEIAKLNNILKTWEKNNILAIDIRDDEARRPRKYFVVGIYVSEPVPDMDDDNLAAD